MSSVSTFIELFSLGRGALAPTGAPPRQRLPILIEALSSGSARQQQLALMACEAALNTRQQYRTLDPEPIGLRVSPPLWTHSTWGEIYDAYRDIWLLVRDHVTG